MESRGSDERGRRWLRWVLWASAVAIVVYFVWAIWDYRAVVAWMERARPVPFFVAMAVLPALGLPFTPLYLLAGATFDLPVAIIGTALALVVNLTFCYSVGRSRLRPRLIALFKRFGWELPDFDIEHGKSTFAALRFTTLVKVAPGVPGFVKNYGLGAARVPFGVYFAVAMTFSAVYAIALILFGDSLFQHELDRGTITLLVVAGLVLVLRWWVKRQERHEPVAAH